MWNFLTISVLSRICRSFLIKRIFVKLAVWLVVVVGIAVAMDFFFFFFLACFSAFWDLLVNFFSLGEMWRQHSP